MKVKCKNCGLIREFNIKDDICPECGCRKWWSLPKVKEKIDRESLEMVENLIGEAYDMAKGFLAEKGYKTFEDGPTMMEVTMKERAKRKMDKIDPFHYRKECKRKDLAFEIFDIKDGNKIRCRKIYLNGHIEGFKGDPCFINYILPKILALKALLKYMNEDYKDFMTRYALGGLPPELTAISSLYKENLKRINEIKI